MTKRVTVMLFGKMVRKGIQIDAEATQGATVAKDLKWPDGTLVTEDDIRNPSGSGGGDDTSGPQPTLWSLILGIPELIEQLAALVAPGYVYHDGTNLQAHEHPLHDSVVADTETLTIPADKQYLIYDEIAVDAGGELVIEAGGELVILGAPLPEPTGPDFTYSGDQLSQIDYDDGEQKLFTYNGSGQLTQIDYIRDGLTLRKELFYDLGGNLDYIDEYYV